MTMIARVADGLPLAASIQEDEQVSNVLKIRPPTFLKVGKIKHYAALNSTDPIYVF